LLVEGEEEFRVRTTTTTRQGDIDGRRLLDFAAAIETSHGANDRLTDCAARQPDGGRAAGEWTDGHSGRRNQMWNNWFRKAIRQSVLQACSGETTTFRRR